MDMPKLKIFSQKMYGRRRDLADRKCFCQIGRLEIFLVHKGILCRFFGNYLLVLFIDSYYFFFIYYLLVFYNLKNVV
jgi:hypothetical protein